MNRSALCIQMLHILYGRNTPIKKQELAQLLETNSRNVIEFKKELETAGYVIESTTGKYGGYVLKEESIFPSLALNKQEMQALQEANEYLKQAAPFQYYPSFASAFNKWKAKGKSQSIQNEVVYLSNTKTALNAEENTMWQVLQKAKEQEKRVTFWYCSAQSDNFEERKIEPYEIIVNEDGYYVLGYDLTNHKKHDFKFFKISISRMKDVQQTQERFARELDFKVQEYTGKHTLMKDFHEVEVEIKEQKARLVLEKGVDNVLSTSWDKGVLRLRFMMEGDLRVKQFLLSLGKDVKVIAPVSIKEEIRLELEAAYQQYT